MYVCSCVRGNLVEINENLTDIPNLIRTKVKDIYLYVCNVHPIIIMNDSHMEYLYIWYLLKCYEAMDADFINLQIDHPSFKKIMSTESINVNWGFTIDLLTRAIDSQFLALWNVYQLLQKLYGMYNSWKMPFRPSQYVTVC